MSSRALCLRQIVLQHIYGNRAIYELRYNFGSVFFFKTAWLLSVWKELSSWLFACVCFFFLFFFFHVLVVCVLLPFDVWSGRGSIVSVPDYCSSTFHRTFSDLVNPGNLL